jgi:phage terminase large subunit GpA-like protein
VQGAALFWMVCAWGQGFDGDVIDYGTFPDQKRDHFTLRDIRKTLKLQFKGQGLEGSIYSGLEALTEHLMGREWMRDDGAAMRLSRCAVDANWGDSTEVVYRFCRQSKHAAVLMPSHGRYVGASSTPWDYYKRKPGELLGNHWMIPSIKGKRAVRHLLIDTNFWKSFVHKRLAVAMGDPGGLALWGKQPDTHRLLADHLTAEYCVRTSSQGRTVDEWKAKPGKPDNHWFDCLVGCATLASMCGCNILSKQMPVARARTRRGSVRYL